MRHDDSSHNLADSCAGHCHVDMLDAFASKGANVHAKVISGDKRGCVSLVFHVAEKGLL